jgi:hypothetical protein
MSLPGKTIKFGDLLVRLELLKEPDLMDSLKVAPQFGLPLGRTLVLSGLLSENELQLAIEVQNLVNHKGYSIASAKQAADLVRNHGVSPAEALMKTGVQSTGDKSTLGSMLLEAGAITSQQLADAQKVGYETGIRLGRALVLHGAINHNLLTRALDLQNMVRQRKLSNQQAIDFLVAEVPKQKNVSLSLEAHSLKPAPAKKQVRFGEFLVLCGLATEAEILNAMEMSLNKQRSLGEAIVELGLISKKVFDRAVELHEAVCAGALALGDATDEVHKMVFGAPAHNAAKNEEGAHGPVVLGELLKITGLVNDQDISEAIELSNKYPSLIGKMLVVSGAIDEATLIASLRCQYLLKWGYINMADAVRCLQYTKKNRVSFDDALEELGIRKPIVS